MYIYALKEWYLMLIFQIPPHQDSKQSKQASAHTIKRPGAHITKIPQSHIKMFPSSFPHQSLFIPNNQTHHADA
jgi:hypothetical protein